MNLSSIDRIGINTAFRKISSTTRAEQVLDMLSRGAMHILKSINRPTKILGPCIVSFSHTLSCLFASATEIGAEPNSGSHEGRSLQIALRNDDIRATELLLRAGPDGRIPNAVGSLVDTAISQANVHIARLLMEKVTDVNAPVDPSPVQVPPETETWKLWVSF